MAERNKVTIATHSGQFHTDDVCAVAMLSLLLEKDNDIRVIRTRDMHLIRDADFVVDVGDVYDADKNRFDHHQEGRAGKRPNGIFYSSFGLVWKKYGDVLCGDKRVADDIEQRLIWPIDARDNGMVVSNPVMEDVYMYDIGDFFGAYRITWKEEEKDILPNFMYCVGLAKNLIQREIKDTQDKFEAGTLIEEEYLKAPDKRLLILDKYYPRNADFLSKYPDVLLVISPKLIDGTWGLETVRTDLRTYDARIDLPQSWAGKRDAELESVTGVSGSVFCHNGRFIAVAKTKEAAIQLAHIALIEAGK